MLTSLPHLTSSKKTYATLAENRKLGHLQRLRGTVQKAPNASVEIQQPASRESALEKANFQVPYFDLHVMFHTHSVLKKRQISI